MANNTPGQSHGDSGANKEAELTDDDGGNISNNSLVSTTTTAGGTTDVVGASGTLITDPTDATIGNSGSINSTSLSIGDASTGKPVPLVAENSSGEGDESGVAIAPRKDDTMSTATILSCPVKLLGTTFLFLAMQVTKPSLQVRMM